MGLPRSWSSILSDDFGIWRHLSSVWLADRFNQNDREGAETLSPIKPP